MQWILSKSWLPKVALALLPVFLGSFSVLQNPISGVVWLLFAVVGFFLRTRVLIATLGLVIAALTQLLLSVPLALANISVLIFILVFALRTKKRESLIFTICAIAAVLTPIFSTASKTSGAQHNEVFLYESGFFLLLGFSAYFLGRYVFGSKRPPKNSLNPIAVASRMSELEFANYEQRNRFEIARELAEVLLQDITAVLSVSDGAVYAAKTDPAAATRALSKISSSARSAHNELRRLFEQLDQAIDIKAAPPKLADLQSNVVALRESGYNVTLTASGDAFEIIESAELAIYRIVLGAIDNIQKHVPVGSTVTIEFMWVEDSLQVLIKDNGIEILTKRAGYTAEDDISALVNPIVGPGVAAMRERAKLFGGNLEITKTPGVGFTVSAMFPNLRSVASTVETDDAK